MKRFPTWLTSTVVFLLVWWGASTAYGRFDVFPSPLTVLNLLASTPLDFLGLGGRTAYVALLGLFAASLFAAALSVPLIVMPRVASHLWPLLVMLKATPAVAFAPLLVVAIGTGWKVKTAVAALIAFFPLIVEAVDGAKRTPKPLLLTATSYGDGRLLTRWRTFRHIQVGYVVSGYVTGLKTAAPLAVVGAIVGEFVDATPAGREGIGGYILRHSRDVYMEHVFVGVFVSAVLGVTLFALAQGISAILDRKLHLANR